MIISRLLPSVSLCQLQPSQNKSYIDTTTGISAPPIGIISKIPTIRDSRTIELNSKKPSLSENDRSRQLLQARNQADILLTKKLNWFEAMTP